MSLSILNVGEGDTKLTFDPDKPGELERTRRVVQDMLKLGYAIVVRAGETKDGKPKYKRVTKFDPKTDEYIVRDSPTEETRIPAATTTGVAVARSAGGMSAAADSIEMQNLERFDAYAESRNMLRKLSSDLEFVAGIPLVVDNYELVCEPEYPCAELLKNLEETAKEDKDNPPAVVDAHKKVQLRNQFYSHHRRCDIGVFDVDDHIEHVHAPAIHHAKIDIHTMGASVAWGVEQEAVALTTLAELLPEHHTFKKYVLAGSFLESSERSGITYWFRKLKPTIALKEHKGDMKIMAALCMHPIAYYAGTWAGAMCPTDDVIAHLMLMRGDEAMYWRRCNQHSPHRPEAGL